MTNFFRAHEVGCSPIRPCVSCRAVRFLKSKLTDADFGHFVEIATNASSRSSDAYSAENPAPLDFNLDDLDLPSRISNTLKNESIETLEQLLRMKPINLLRMPNIGRKSLADLNDAVNKIGHKLLEK